MRQYLTAEIQALSKSDLEGIVDPYFMQVIKHTDPDPEIRVYSIGHEGKSNLHLPGIGNKTFTWIQAAVQWISDKLNVGTAVFDRHDPNTNSHSGREKIGEVVGKAVRTIGDRLNALAAIYVLPEFRSRPLDVASIEAEIEFAHDGVQAWPTEVKTVSGVALSNSGIDTPGFPGATLLGAVQAYVQAFGSEIQGAGTMALTKAEVKQAIRDLGLAPTDVFEIGVIMDDSQVVDKVKEAKQNVIKGSERITQERDELREKLVKVENDYSDLAKKLQQIETGSKTTPVLEAVIAERKINDKAKAFITRSAKNLKPTATDEAGLKQEIAQFVDTQITEYNEVAKSVFGIDVAAQQTTTPGQSQTTIPREFTVAGQQPQQNQNTQTNQQQRFVDPGQARDARLAAEMDPNTNPLIPGGKAAREALKA